MHGVAYNLQQCCAIYRIALHDQLLLVLLPQE